MGTRERMSGEEVPDNVSQLPGAGERPQGWSYRPVDLSNVSTDPVVADLLEREDGVHLFYRGRINWLFGQPESGKTWVAALVAKQVLEAGGRVLWLDMEDLPQTFLERMTSLGIDRAVAIDQDRVRYVQPQEPLFTNGKAWTSNLAEVNALREWRPDLVVFDACAESMGIEGKSVTSNDDVAEWMAHVIRPWQHIGAAVLVLDHLPKSNDNAGDRYPIGGQHKLAGLDGSAIRARITQRFGRHPGGTPEPIRGVVELTVTKDRSGGVRGQLGNTDGAGELVLDVHPNGSVGSFIREAGEAQAERIEAGNADIVADVQDIIRELGPSGLNALFAAIKDEPYGRKLGHRTLKGALDVGVSKGWLTIEHGPNRSTLYSIGE